eukprot:55772-Chlamydomonas_euryale.AAC.1
MPLLHTSPHFSHPPATHACAAVARVAALCVVNGPQHEAQQACVRGDGMPRTRSLRCERGRAGGLAASQV